MTLLVVNSRKPSSNQLNQKEFIGSPNPMSRNIIFHYSLIQKFQTMSLDCLSISQLFFLMLSSSLCSGCVKMDIQISRAFLFYVLIQQEKKWVFLFLKMLTYSTETDNQYFEMDHVSVTMTRAIGCPDWYIPKAYPCPWGLGGVNSSETTVKMNDFPRVF